MFLLNKYLKVRLQSYSQKIHKAYEKQLKCCSLLVYHCAFPPVTWHTMYGEGVFYLLKAKWCGFPKGNNFASELPLSRGLLQNRCSVNPLGLEPSHAPWEQAHVITPLSVLEWEWCFVPWNMGLCWWVLIQWWHHRIWGRHMRWPVVQGRRQGDQGLLQWSRSAATWPGRGAVWRGRVWE